MINCSLATLSSVISQLALEEIIRGEGPDGPLAPNDIEHVEGWLTVVMAVSDDFGWKAVPDRVGHIRRQIGFGITQSRAALELRVLRQTIDFELKGKFLYRYPEVEGGILSTWKEDWALARQSFPSSEMDIYAAVDLWALQHSTASVFHLMRVLEHGLRALAADLEKSFDIQNWQNILNEIESEIRNQAKSFPRGQAKTDRLRFLSEAAKEFHFFKDGWRNYVAHNRGFYDQHGARSVMDHVRSFMNGLAIHLKE